MGLIVDEDGLKIQSLLTENEQLQGNLLFASVELDRQVEEHERTAISSLVDEPEEIAKLIIEYCFEK